MNRGSYFSIHFTENEVERHQLSTRKLQSAASIGSYILEGWQSNVIYFPSNAIKAYFEVWRDEKLAVNFGLPINFAGWNRHRSLAPCHLSGILRDDAYEAGSRNSHKLKLQVTRTQTVSGSLKFGIFHRAYTPARCIMRVARTEGIRAEMYTSRRKKFESMYFVHHFFGIPAESSSIKLVFLDINKGIIGENT